MSVAIHAQPKISQGRHFLTAGFSLSAYFVAAMTGVACYLVRRLKPSVKSVVPARFLCEWNAFVGILSAINSTRKAFKQNNAGYMKQV